MTANIANEGVDIKSLCIILHAMISFVVFLSYIYN